VSKLKKQHEHQLRDLILQANNAILSNPGTPVIVIDATKTKSIEAVKEFKRLVSEGYLGQNLDGSHDLLPGWIVQEQVTCGKFLIILSRN